MRTMLLPCHHTIFVRSILKRKKLIPINYVHSRWLLQSEANRPQEDGSDDDVSCSAFRVLDSHMRSLKHAVLNGSTKWRTGMDVAERVVEAMSSQGTRSFLAMAASLRKFGEYASQGIIPVIAVSEQEHSHPHDGDRGSDNGAVNTGGRLSSDSSSGDSGEEISDDSNVPPTLRTKAKVNEIADESGEESNSKSDGDIGGQGGESDIDGEGESEVIDTTENNQEESGEILAADGARLIVETDRIVRRSREMVSPECESDTDTLVKHPNQLVKDAKQLVKNTNQLVGISRQLKIRKRDTNDKDRGGENEDTSSSEDDTRQFQILKSMKSKGRPKIRKKQQREAKRIRMEESMEQANALVQGTLVPVKDLALVRKLLDCSFNVTDALPVLGSITQVDAPAWKATSIVQIARKRKVQRQVTIVSPTNYLTKCLAGIKTYRSSLPSEHDAGKMEVTIAKLGTFSEKDLITMRQWRDEMPKLEAINDLVSWIRLSKFSRVSLPRPLNNCVKVDMKACAKRLETANLKAAMVTRFGSIPVHEIASFRRSVWLDDACFMLVISYLIEQNDEILHQRGIGGVNPLYARMADDDTKRDVIEFTSSFQRGNQIVLVSTYLESHWSGVVFDFTANKLVFFDPMQSKANYKAMEAVINEFFGEHISGLEQIRQRAPKQEDTNSCGPLTLLVFQCMVRGIPVPNVPLETIPYLRFRYLFLSSKCVFCQSPDVDTVATE